jgi:hypothetical protein
LGGTSRAERRRREHGVGWASPLAATPFLEKSSTDDVEEPTFELAGRRFQGAERRFLLAQRQFVDEARQFLVALPTFLLESPTFEQELRTFRFAQRRCVEECSTRRPKSSPFVLAGASGSQFATTRQLECRGFPLEGRRFSLERRRFALAAPPFLLAGARHLEASRPRIAAQPPRRPRGTTRRRAADTTNVSRDARHTSCDGSNLVPAFLHSRTSDCCRSPCAVSCTANMPLLPVYR